MIRAEGIGGGGGGGVAGFGKKDILNLLNFSYMQTCMVDIWIRGSGSHEMNAESTDWWCHCRWGSSAILGP